MSLIVSIPGFCINEQRYILGVILDEFFGLEYSVRVHDDLNIMISLVSSEKYLQLNADFFRIAHNNWQKQNSLPELPLKRWFPKEDGVNARLLKEEIPILYGQPGIVKSNTCWHIKLDIFGSAFFMISRYEESIVSNRDKHNRFPAVASVALKEDFLDRPIVNEYMEILWTCMHSLWPGIRRKKRDFRKLISCDVDHPSDLVGNNFKKTFLRVTARIIRDKNPILAFLDALNFFFRFFKSDDRFDQYKKNIFWMMSVNQRVANKICFNFIPIQTDRVYEDSNDIRSNEILSLLKHIVDAGHDIGFHPGYMTYNNPEIFRESAEALKEACKSIGVQSHVRGGRQHYLRYDVNVTPLLWEKNGFKYDSSLGYAEKAGFRAGICYEYSMYDLFNRRKLLLKQRPLIVMDGTIFSQEYEGMGLGQKAEERFKYFKEVCHYYSGDFTLLWHNSFFFHSKSKIFYKNIIGQ